MNRIEKKCKIEDVLERRRLLSPADLELLRVELYDFDEEAKIAILQKKALLSEEEGYQALAEIHDLPFINLQFASIDPAAVGRIESSFARKNLIIPFAQVGNELSVAMANPRMMALDELELSTGCSIHVHIATRTQILAAIDVQYSRTESLGSIARLDIKDDTSPAVIRLSQFIILAALKERASDIHIEPEVDYVRLRFRVDGSLREQQRLPKESHRPLVARFKVMAGCDISETRRPQDGRIRLDVGSRTIDLRISIVPSYFGEKIVMRVLDKSGVSLDIDQMYFSTDVYANIRRVISATNGVILVTGPTGSGKTTTCYSIINHLNSIERNIVTIENPIEYQLPIITQIQVEHQLGLDFSSILRSVLRQDPDIIFVGEIRDLETAKIATEAALTGHLVISTMHTNNAIQAVIRLVELGVAPFFVAPTIVGVIGQRLTKKICPHCSAPYKPSEEELSYFNVTPEQKQKIVLHRGAGCDACRGYGFRGRLPLHELVVVSDEMRDRMVHHVGMLEMEQLAMDAGYKTLRHDGLKKALMGLTTLEAVLSVTTAKDDFQVR